MDNRYTITPEYCGYTSKRYVARFCGTWLGQAFNKEAAQAIVAAYEAKRQERMVKP